MQSPCSSCTKPAPGLTWPTTNRKARASHARLSPGTFSGPYARGVRTWSAMSTPRPCTPPVRSPGLAQGRARGTLFTNTGSPPASPPWPEEAAPAYTCSPRPRRSPTRHPAPPTFVWESPSHLPYGVPYIQWGGFVPALSEPITHDCEGSKVGAIPIEEGMMRNGAAPDVGPPLSPGACEVRSPRPPNGHLWAPRVDQVAYLSGLERQGCSW